MAVTFTSTTHSSLKVFYSSLNLNWGVSVTSGVHRSRSVIVCVTEFMFNLFNGHVSLYRKLTAAGSPGQGPRRHPHASLHNLCQSNT